MAHHSVGGLQRNLLMGLCMAASRLNERCFSGWSWQFLVRVKDAWTHHEQSFSKNFSLTLSSPCHLPGSLTKWRGTAYGWQGASRQVEEMCWWGRAIGAGLTRSPRQSKIYMGRLRLRGRLGPGSVCWCSSAGPAPRWGTGKKRGKGKTRMEDKKEQSRNKG